MILEYLGDTDITENSAVRMNREIPDGVVARGNPAEVMREVSQRDRDFRAFGKEYYVELTKKYLSLERSRIG